MAEGMRVMLMASGDLWAGAEVMVAQLALGMKERQGHDIIVVLLNHGRLADNLKSCGIDVRVVDEAKESFLSLALAVRQIIKQFSPHIIHSHRYKENLLAWICSLRNPGVRLVATQHGMPEMAGEGKSISCCFRSALFFRLLSFCFQRTVVVSHEMKQALTGTYGYTANNIKVIHNGISVPDDVIHHSRERIVVGSAGRLFPVKDFSLLVEIARHVIDRNKIVEFVLAGDGPQRSMLEEKVNSYSMQEYFTFLGHQEDMDAFYRNLDIYINTSVHEGIPMSVLEAMSYGLPVIVPAVGGFPEIIQNGVQGFLVDGRKIEIYTERILQLLAEPDLRLSMASSARQRVFEGFSQEAMVQAYFDIYTQVRSCAVRD